MSSRGGVLLLHGHGRLGASMARLGGAARRAGYPTFAPNYPFRRPLAQIVAWLAPRVQAFAAASAGPLHIVTHSLGGLVARALIATERPLRLGRVVMLAPPNAGSELADLLFRLRLAPIMLGGSGAHLRTNRPPAHDALLGPVDFPLGIIAGDRPFLPLPFALLPHPHDGKVSVAATRIDRMTDHIVLPVTHMLMVYDRRVIAETMTFVEAGRFSSRAH